MGADRTPGAKVPFGWKHLAQTVSQESAGAAAGLTRFPPAQWSKSKGQDPAYGQLTELAADNQRLANIFGHHHIEPAALQTEQNITDSECGGDIYSHGLDQDPQNARDIVRAMHQEDGLRVERTSGRTTLTHVDSDGRATMIGVGEKAVTLRTARASACVHLGSEVFQLVAANKMRKGDVLPAAQLAGIMAAKQTSHLIPLCHNIALSKVHVSLSLDAKPHQVQVSAEVQCMGQTGAEMEALTAVSVAALTVYDMCKAASHDIVIGDIRLESKGGGQSGQYNRAGSMTTNRQRRVGGTPTMQ